ncbi:hypothetical protein GQ457_11G031760 [Hibiscus cannabinus]
MVWTLFVGNLSDQIHWKGLWQVFDRYGRVLDSFIPQKRALDGRRFGFVRMYSEAEAIRVRDCLHGKWIHGSRIRVNFAERDSRNQYWRRKRSDYKSTSTPQSAKGRSASRAGGVDGLSAEHRVLRRVEGSVSEDSMAVLQRCSIGCCRNPISNSSLAEELRMEKVLGVHVMRLAGPRVLLIFDSIEVRQQMMDSGVLDRWFSLVVDWSTEGSALECRRAWISVFGVPVHAWSRDTFERLVSHWGSVILLEEATAEPSSFERGRVLVESSVLERIEERLELVVEGQSSSEDVASRDDEDLCPNELEEGQVIATGGPVVGIEEMATDEAKATAVVSKDLLIVPSDEPEVEGVRWRGNDLWNGQEEASNAMVQTEDAEQLVDVVVICAGPGFEGSNAEVKLVNNNSRKVRLLSDVISSLQTPEEKRKEIKKGRGRPRKVSVSNAPIADISLSDSDLAHRQEVLLKEATATVEFGKLLGATTVGGIGSSVKRSAIRKVLRQQRIELAFLVETKLEDVSEAVVKSLWWTDSFTFLMSASVGLSGGILIIWEQDLWRRLLSVIGDLTEPCCCGGDFNAVLSLDKRRHCVGDLRNMTGFRSFVEEAGLLDIPAAGKVFTWYGAGSKASRLDRFLVSPLWVEKFRGLEQFILNRGVSDHASVRLSSGECDWGPRLFRFLNCWLEKKGHVRLMESEWRRIGEAACSPVNILEKLRRLKSFLKVWNRESFGSVDLQIEVTTDLLNDLDERIGGVEEVQVTKRQLQGNLWKLLKYRSSIWRQKSRIQWLREDDRNTKFFQQAAKIRGMRNYIRGLQINGRWVSLPKLLKRSQSYKNHRNLEPH